MRRHPGRVENTKAAAIDDGARDHIVVRGAGGGDDVARDADALPCPGQTTFPLRLAAAFVDNLCQVLARTESGIVEATDRRRWAEGKEADIRIDAALAPVELENRVIEQDVGLETADSFVGLENDIDQQVPFVVGDTTAHVDEDLCECGRGQQDQSYSGE
jgi:hypothetical protein